TSSARRCDDWRHRLSGRNIKPPGL
ncbi:putative nADP-dependent oxidoreductase yncb, partial [Vibrio parahaemolyticus V-223/04]